MKPSATRPHSIAPLLLIGACLFGLAGCAGGTRGTGISRILTPGPETPEPPEEAPLGLGNLFPRKVELAHCSVSIGGKQRAIEFRTIRGASIIQSSQHGCNLQLAAPAGSGAIASFGALKNAEARIVGTSGSGASATVLTAPAAGEIQIELDKVKRFDSIRIYVRERGSQPDHVMTLTIK